METVTGPLWRAERIVVSFLARKTYRDTLPTTGVTPLVKPHVVPV